MLSGAKKLAAAVAVTLGPKVITRRIYAHRPFFMPLRPYEYFSFGFLNRVLLKRF